MPPGVAGRKTAPTGVMSPKVFHPTMEEFSNFLGYIEKIEREDNAHLAGIAKIVPPKEWVPRKAGYNLEDLNFEIEGPIKQRFQQVGSRGCYQTKGIIQQKLNVVDYHKMATSQKYNTPNHADYDDLERKYWKSLQFVPPVYGCDVSSNISDPELEIWNIAKLDSILKYVSKDLNTVIQGVNSPYLYFGMWKATFSWHVEDMDLYGINMVHHGAPKTWYCVPPQHGHLMEKACRSLFPNVASWCSNFMRHKTCLIAPDILDKYGVPYQKVVQEERDIIVVFPYAYHSGFNHGFNIAESTNFATERWIEYGKRQRPCDCDRSRVKFSMDEFVKRFQPENFEAWMKNLDIAPHPEDPPEVVSEINLRAENPAEYARQLEQKLRKTEEKRLKKFEQQKESKLSTSQQSSSDESGSMLVYVYRHVEYSQIEVELNAKSLKFHSGKQILVDFLQKDEIDVQELIRNGLLVKVADRRIKRSKRKAPEHSSTTEQTHITEQRMVEMYKHCTEENIHITVDPLTKELTSPPSTKLLDFIKTAGDDVTIKQLIEMGVFSRVCECIMEIKKVEVLSESQPPSKKLKSDPDAAENSWLQQVTADIGATGPPMIKHLVIYRHRTTGDHLTVSALRKKVIGRKTEKVIQMLDGKSVEQLIDEGLLIKVGERKTRSGVPLKPKETPTSSIGVVKRALFRLSFDDEEKGGTFELASNGQTSVYSFEMNEDLMAVLITTKANQDNLSALGPEDQCHTPLEIIQSLLSPTLSIKPCPRHPVGGEKQDGCVACVNGSDLQGAFPARKAIMGNDYKSVNEAAKSIQQGFDASKGVITFKHVDKNRVYLVKTEQLAASLFPSTTSFKKGPSVKDEIKEAEGQNEDTDEEELFTSDDSSESNDESSDDPDYYGSGSVKEWKSNSKSRSTKKKKRLMRQMRTERLTRRNGHSNGSSKKRQTRIINSTHTLREVTKKMLERTYPEGNQLFKLDDLVSEIGEERVLIMKVIRILRGFNAIQKVDDQSYTWSGLDDAMKTAVLHGILKKNSDDENTKDDLWSICRDVLYALLTSRKGSRVHLPLIAPNCNVDEATKITNVASIIEALGLVDRLTDNLGGLVYKGPDLYKKYCHDQYILYRDEMALKEVKLSLKPVSVAEENRYEVISPAFARTLAFEGAATDDDEEVRRSIKNREVNCKCGIRKTLDKGVVIQREGHKTHVRKQVFVGGQRRRRCKRCTACLAPRCEKCIFCLNPSMKKPCQDKVCLFPIVPKCPCFS